MALCTVVGNVRTVLLNNGYTNSLGPGPLSGTVQFTLVNIGSDNTPIAIATEQLAPIIVRAPVNTDGSFLAQLQGNDGLIPANTFYQVGVFVPGVAEASIFYSITGTSLNLNFATPLTNVQVAELAPNLIPTGYSVVSISANYNILFDTYSEIYLFVTTGLQTISVVFPSALFFPKRIATVKKIDSGIGQVNIVSLGGNFDGNGLYILSNQYQYAKFISDGANWNVVANN